MSRDHVKRVVVVTYGKHSLLCKHTRTVRLISSLFSLLYSRQRGQVLILHLLLLIQIHLIESLLGNRRKLGRKSNKDRLGFGPNQALKSNLLVFWKVGDKLTVRQALFFVWPFSYPKNQYFTLKWLLFCLQPRLGGSRPTGLVHQETTTVLCSLRFHGPSQWFEGKGN